MNSKYYNIVLSCLAAVFISVPMALIMVIMNYGFKTGFLLAFLKSALVGTLISIPLANIGIPISQKIADKIFNKKEKD